MVEITEESIDGVFLIKVNGEIDASSSIHLDNALQKAMEASDRILVDLSNLEYISSAGLGVFISYIEELKKQATKMVLFGMQEKVKQVFEILGLSNLITISETEDKALELVNES